MEETALVRLDLRAPLLYTAAPELIPFAYRQWGMPDEGESAAEFLFCFELDPQEAGRIDPLEVVASVGYVDTEGSTHPGSFLGRLVFSGKGNGAQGTAVLAAGRYLFTQRREALDREACIRLAIEQQKDGLWERLKLENHLYIRCLYEDGSAVTQILRPYTTND